MNVTCWEQPKLSTISAEVILLWRGLEIFILLNILDGYTTYRGLKSPNVWEASPLLGNRPTPERIIIQKALGTYYVHRYVLESDLKILNKALFYLVINNVEALNKVDQTLLWMI